MEKLKNREYNSKEVHMQTSNMKNMVVLKNLPSNLVEEAIVILKSSKKVKKLEKIEKNNNVNKSRTDRSKKDYILKEAEMLVSSYISKLESNHQQRQYRNVKMNKKYNQLKKYAYLSSAVIIVQAVIILMQLS